MRLIASIASNPALLELGLGRMLRGLLAVLPARLVPLELETGEATGGLILGRATQ